jgi:hypothetical protein
MFQKLIKFFHDHPAIKTTLITLGAGTLTAASGGAYGPKGASIAAAVTAALSLFTKRPQDAGGIPVVILTPDATKVPGPNESFKQPEQLAPEKQTTQVVTGKQGPNFYVR